MLPRKLVSVCPSYLSTEFIILTVTKFSCFVFVFPIKMYPWEKRQLELGHSVAVEVC